MRIIWDDFGQRFYEAGVDRCVVYPPVGMAVPGGQFYPQYPTGVPWNGVISISENFSNSDKTDLYYDGIKYAESYSLSEFSGTVTAYTYPDALLKLEGVEEVGGGLYIANQKQQRFGLTYRTKIGNEFNDLDSGGYKIHILYNLIATPSAKTYQTISSSTDPIIFQWDITATPAEVPGFSPSAHLIFDTRYMEADLIEDIEDVLYGNNVNDPRLPEASTLVGFVNSWTLIKVTDNFDGTFTVDGPDNLIVDNLDETYMILRANTSIFDGDSYWLTNTTY